MNSENFASIFVTTVQLHWILRTCIIRVQILWSPHQYTHSTVNATRKQDGQGTTERIKFVGCVNSQTQLLRSIACHKSLHVDCLGECLANECMQWSLYSLKQLFGKPCNTLYLIASDARVFWSVSGYEKSKCIIKLMHKTRPPCFETMGRWVICYSYNYWQAARFEWVRSYPTLAEGSPCNHQFTLNTDSLVMINALKTALPQGIFLPHKLLASRDCPY